MILKAIIKDEVYNLFFKAFKACYQKVTMNWFQFIQSKNQIIVGFSFD